MLDFELQRLVRHTPHPSYGEHMFAQSAGKCVARARRTYVRTLTTEEVGSLQDYRAKDSLEGARRRTILLPMPEGIAIVA